jgi:hypothetical protein
VLRDLLQEVLPEGDVVFESSPAVKGGNLSAMHKVIGGRDVYFVANSSDTPVDVFVRLRGPHALEEWDPHTGRIRAAEATIAQGSTRLRVSLPPVQSRLYVAPSP